MVPCPASLTVRVKFVEVKLAVALRLLFMTTWQGLAPVQAPLHPENSQPAAGVAFIATALPIV